MGKWPAKGLGPRSGRLRDSFNCHEGAFNAAVNVPLYGLGASGTDMAVTQKVPSFVSTIFMLRRHGFAAELEVDPRNVN